MLPLWCSKAPMHVDHAAAIAAIHQHHTQQSRLCYLKAPDGDYADVPVKFSNETTTLKVLETCYGYYVKPTERHYKYDFENFFGFGPGCLGYNPNECVLIRK